MWSIEKLEEIRDACMKDIVEIYPKLYEKMARPRIEINHKTSTTLARYIEISAYLFSGSTHEIFFRTLVMKGLIRGQICKLIPDLYEEEIVWVLNDRFPGKFDFKEYKIFNKNDDLKKLFEELDNEWDGNTKEVAILKKKYNMPMHQLYSKPANKPAFCFQSFALLFL